MKKSISILGVTESGIKKDSSNIQTNESIELSDNLEDSFKAVLGLAKVSPESPNPYILLGELALKNNAFKIAMDSLSTAKWLTEDSDSKSLNKINDLIEALKEKDLKMDSSSLPFWKGKSPSKSWILKRIYYKNDIETTKNYCLRLLSLVANKAYALEIIYIVFCVENNEEDHFIELVSNNKDISEDLKSLYLGLSFHNSLELEDSNKHLNLILSKDPNNQEAKTYLTLNKFYANDIEGFKDSFKKLDPKGNPLNVCIYFIVASLNKLKLEPIEFPNHNLIASEIKEILEKYYKLGFKSEFDSIINNLIGMNISIPLPTLIPLITEIYLNGNELEKAKRLIDICDDIESIRLNAWISRIEGKEDIAEKLLVEYREKWNKKNSLGFECKTIKISPNETFSKNEEDTIKELSSIYKKVKDATEELEKEYGLDPSTCIEANCQDCCTHTYPEITYAEYLYVRQGLKDKPDSFLENLKLKSKEITNFHKGSPKKGQSFTCPFLDEKICSIYEYRPLTCRIYGFGMSDNGIYKGCNYFYEQFLSASSLSSKREVIGTKELREYAKKTSEVLIGIEKSFPIPLWFENSHEEVIKKLKG